MAARKNERIFNPTGWRHYRRTYSLTEVRIGAVILVGLAAVAAWVAWRGANPDPELFSVNAALLDKGSEFTPRDGVQPGSSPSRGAAQDRGPVPGDLAADGWTEQPISQFDASNLYEKINGREGYYKSFGFQRLYFISLLHSQDDTASVDIEMYDMGKVSNALGAYAGERQPDARPVVGNSGISHLALNALFMVQGRFYIRAIGSDAGDTITAQLNHLRERFEQGLTGEPLPWAYSVFAGQLGLDPGKVGFLPENAFSFGFAKNVYTAEVTDDGAELFMIAARDAAQAKKLAQQFSEGFLSIGKDAGRHDGVAWIEDQYLATLAGAAAVGPLVVGVRGAPDLAFAREQLSRLERVGAGLPAAVLEQAAAAQEQTGPGGGYGEGEETDDGGGDSGGGPGGGEPSPEESLYDEEPGGAEPAGDDLSGDEPSGDEPSSDEEVER